MWSLPQMLHRYRQHIALPTPLSALPIPSRTTSRRPIDGTTSLLSSVIVRVRAHRAAPRRSNSSSSPATRCRVHHSRRDGTPIAGRQRCLAVGRTSRAARQPFGHRSILRNVKACACMLDLLPLLQPPAAGAVGSIMGRKTSLSPRLDPCVAELVPPTRCAARLAMVTDSVYRHLRFSRDVRPVPSEGRTC